MCYHFPTQWPAKFTVLKNNAAQNEKVIEAQIDDKASINAVHTAHVVYLSTNKTEGTAMGHNSIGNTCSRSNNS